jgi:hypothetical protein
VASVRYEDSDRPPREIYFESPSLDADWLVAAPHAFAVGALAPALTTGEARLHVDGAVDPGLRVRMERLSRRFNEWNDRPGPGLAVESSGSAPPAPSGTRREVGMLFSGGLDALALLRADRLRRASGDAEAIRKGVFIFGMNTFDFADGAPVPERLAAFERYLSRLDGFGRQVGLEILPVATNLRPLMSWTDLWNLLGAPPLLAGGLAVSQLLARLWVASDGRERRSDPLSRRFLDLCDLSSSFTSVAVGQPEMGRMEKAALVADWPPARDVLRSCVWYDLPPDGALNCGRCEKCIRTMLAFAACGRLDVMSTFPGGKLSAADVDAIAADAGTRRVESYYRLMVEDLRRAGRSDLGDAVVRLTSVGLDDGDAPGAPADGGPGLWHRVRRWAAGLRPG